ncbi:MAG: T9SS type A sorting domain-containing protein, partial [Bacteroidota bacterium]
NGQRKAFGSLIFPIINGQMGNVQITLTADDGEDQDTESFTLTVDNCTSIETPAFAQGLQLYPNPVQSKLQVRFAQRTMVEAWKVFDLSGKLIQSASPQQMQQQIELDLVELPEGVYFLQIQAEGQVFSQKFVKQ